MGVWNRAEGAALTSIHDLTTPALLIDGDALEHNLRTMTAALPGARLRPHVKAHKCTALARRQAAEGHRSFCCATVRELVGMAAAGLRTVQWNGRDGRNLQTGSGVYALRLTGGGQVKERKIVLLK